MRKNIFTLTAIAFMLVLGACSNDEVAIVEEETKQEAESFTISVVASLPDDQTPSVSAYGFDESPTTRVALEDSESAVKVEWKDGDILRLGIVQNGNFYFVDNNNTVAINPDPSNKKRGIFNIKMSDFGAWRSRNTNPNVLFDKDAPFTIHGVHVNEESRMDDNGRVALPKYDNGHKHTDLADLGKKGGAMLYFTYEHGAVLQEKSDLGITVKFKHVGSLFRINLKNMRSSEIYVDQTRIVGVGNLNNLWAYNNSDSKYKLDFLTGLFFADKVLDNHIKIFNPNHRISAGETQVLWRWHPIDGKEWPAIGIELYSNNSMVATSGNTKKANKPLQVGQVYNFYATVENDNKVYFTDSNFEILDTIYGVAN